MGGIYFKWMGLTYGWDSDIGSQSEVTEPKYFGNDSVQWDFTGDGDAHWIDYQLQDPSQYENLASGSYSQLYFMMKTNNSILMSGARITDHSGNWIESENFVTIPAGDFTEVHVDFTEIDHDEGDTSILCSGSENFEKIGMSFFTQNGVNYSINIDMLRFEKDCTV